VVEQGGGVGDGRHGGPLVVPRGPDGAAVALRPGTACRPWGRVPCDRTPCRIGGAP
jgi:hypothetical protein